MTNPTSFEIKTENLHNPSYCNFINTEYRSLFRCLNHHYNECAITTVDISS